MSFQTLVSSLPANNKKSQNSNFYLPPLNRGGIFFALHSIPLTLSDEVASALGPIYCEGLMVETKGFSKQIFEAVMGGISTLDIPRLDIQNVEQAYEFLKTYGYDLSRSDELDELWALHRRATNLIRDRFLEPTDVIPEILTDQIKLNDPALLLVFASTHTNQDNLIQMWSCAILRVMHVLAHLDNDLFHLYQEEIQKAVLEPIQKHVVEDSVAGTTTLGLQGDCDQIRLKRFDVKQSKSYLSSAIKLLARRNYLAMNIMDKIGVRFVTKNIFDCFRVVRFLVQEHLISFPNIIADSGRNNLYPNNVFFEVLKKIESAPSLTEEQIEELLKAELAASMETAEFQEKRNDFSGKNFRAIKFIARKLIEVPSGERTLHFFFPYEIQIIDYETYLKNISGPEAHAEYKLRQREAARLRALGPLAQFLDEQRSRAT